MNKIIFLSLLFFGLFNVTISSAQSGKTCDLSIGIISPSPFEVYDFGDTAYIILYVKNNGPDDITMNDTIYCNLFGVSSVFPNQIISSGDSDIVNLGQLYNPDEENDTVSFTVYLTGQSSTFNDPNKLNDSASVTFILKGSSTGIADVSGSGAPEKIALYPNPASTFVSIPLDNTLRKEGAVYVKDLLGRTCLQYSYGPAAVSGSKALQLDISALKPGVYFVEVNAAGKRYSGKLLIRK